MYGLSVYFTKIDKEDKDIYCYDNISMVIVKAMEILEMYDVKFINFADYEGTDNEELINQLSFFISSYKNDLLVTNVDLSYIEFGNFDFSNLTEDDEEKIENALARDCNLISGIGFEQVPLDNLSLESFLFIYPNEVGRKMIDYLKTIKMKDIEENKEE